MFAIMVSLSISRLIISADSHCIIWYILCQCNYLRFIKDIAHFTRPVTIVVALAVHEILKRPIVKIVISLPFYLKMTVSFALPQFVVPIHLALITSLNIVSPNSMSLPKYSFAEGIFSITPGSLRPNSYLIIKDMFSSHTIFRIITAVLIKTHKVECVVEENEYA
ncbi:hypothetical protein F4703DRAFT_1795955 [Phycomyces blakesleeanus]